MKQKPWWKRLLIGCGWLSAITVLLVIILAAWNWPQIRVLPPLVADIMAEPVYAGGLNTPQEVLAYLQARPDTVALIAYSVAPDSTAVPDESQIWHNPD
ncbi:MAG: hypothetical protein R6X32_20995, partial [Chloroflexota bacterium]